MLLGLAGFGQSVFADAVRIGVVDLQKIVQTSPQIKTIQQSLEQKFRSRRDALVNTEKDLKAKIEAFKKD